MARKQKPVKIKRYKNSMGSGTGTVYKIKQTVPVILGLALVVLLGFMLGKPILGFLSNAGGGDSSSQDISQSLQTGQSSLVSQPSENPVSSDSNTEQSSDISVIPPVTSDNRVYYYVSAASLTTEAGIDSVISQMQSKGATHLVFDVKNADGNINYASSNQYASQLLATVQLDLPLISAKLAEKGITPVARVYTFMDKMISTVERSTAVMYQGTETRWLDSSAALGGKAWANPASQIMQEYILDLTDEIMSMGVKEFIFAGFHTPTGYSLDKRDFGATMDQVLANMKSLIGTLEAKISAKGGYSAWQIEYSAVAPEGNYSQYIVHPYQLGIENIIITAKGADTDAAMAVSDLTAAKNNTDTNSISLWFTDNVNADRTKALDACFVG